MLGHLDSQTDNLLLPGVLKSIYMGFKAIKCMQIDIPKNEEGESGEGGKKYWQCRSVLVVKL